MACIFIESRMVLNGTGSSTVSSSSRSGIETVTVFFVRVVIRCVLSFFLSFSESGYSTGASAWSNKTFSM